MSLAPPCPPKTAQHPGGIQIRWMLRRDMPEVLAIERRSFPMPWTEADFMECLRQRNSIGMVAERANDEIVGYMVYQLATKSISLLNFAVHPDYRLRGIGSCMVDKLFSKVSQNRRDRILVHVVEDNLNAHLFWRAMGFKCLRVDRGMFHDPGCPGGSFDGYLFAWTNVDQPVPVNRLEGYFSE